MPTAWQKNCIGSKIAPWSSPPSHRHHCILILLRIGINISNAENRSRGEIPPGPIMNNWQPTSVSQPTLLSSSSSSSAAAKLSSMLTQSFNQYNCIIIINHFKSGHRKLRKATLHQSLATSSENWKQPADLIGIIIIGIIIIGIIIIGIKIIIIIDIIFRVAVT